MIKKHFTEQVLANDLIAQNTYLMKLTCTEDFLRLYRQFQLEGSLQSSRMTNARTCGPEDSEIVSSIP